MESRRQHRAWLSKAVHAEGGHILAQLAHSGGTVLINQPGRASWSASAILSETTGNNSHEMTVAEIEEVINAFAAGAKRAVEGNMDGVEILGSFGFLPQAFISPLSNHRQDHWKTDYVLYLNYWKPCGKLLARKKFSACVSQEMNWSLAVSPSRI